MRTINLTIVALGTALTFFACRAEKSDDKSNPAAPGGRVTPGGRVNGHMDLQVFFFGKDSRGLGLADNSKLEGVYFQELEVVAYSYLPDAPVQTGCGCGGWGSKDWSHWVILQSGHTDARNNVLLVGDQLDLKTLNGDYADANRPSQEFVEKVGQFRIDVFEVSIDGAGVLYDKTFFGPGTRMWGEDAHPLYRYEDLKNYPIVERTPHFSGIDKNRASSVNLFFVRNDWFASSVVVHMDNYSETAKVESSSRPLTEEEEARIISLINGGTGRRFYQDIVVMPIAAFDGPLTINLKRTADEASSDSDQSNNQQTDEPQMALQGLKIKNPVFDADNVDITVDFNLANALTDESDMAPAATSDINFRLSDSGIPFETTFVIEGKN